MLEVKKYILFSTVFPTMQGVSTYLTIMFDPNFVPPKPRIAETQTKKRINIIESLIPELMQCSMAMLLTGSMAYGQDYSITPESDIDLQLLITPEIITKIASCKYFQKYNTKKIIE